MKINILLVFLLLLSACSSPLLSKDSAKEVIQEATTSVDNNVDKLIGYLESLEIDKLSEETQLTIKELRELLKNSNESVTQLTEKVNNLVDKLNKLIDVDTNNESSNEKSWPERLFVALPLLIVGIAILIAVLILIRKK